MPRFMDGYVGPATGGGFEAAVGGVVLGNFSTVAEAAAEVAKHADGRDCWYVDRHGVEQPLAEKLAAPEAGRPSS